MSIVRCEQGHFYNNEKSAQCPQCMSQKGAVSLTSALDLRQLELYVAQYDESNDSRQARALRPREKTAVEEGAPLKSVRMEEEPVFPGVSGEGNRSDGTEASEYFLNQQEERGYLAGWLVCVRGPQKGTDYRLYEGYNRVGTKSTNDIVIKDDVQVAEQDHCSVVYEGKENVFYLLASAEYPTFLNEVRIEGADQIKSGQQITIGETCLELVAFCQGNKRWEP